MFAGMLSRVLHWSRHRNAHVYLGAVSFAESSFFPIPPDLLLAPMVLARPERAWRLAAWTTLWSVVGGVAAFMVASYAIDTVTNGLRDVGYWDSYLRTRVWFEQWGFLAVLVAGFSPIPYKVFAFAAGGMSMFLPAFIAASIAGRGGRFFLVAGLIARGGPRMERALKSYVNRLGWLVVAAAVAIYSVLRLW